MDPSDNTGLIGCYTDDRIDRIGQIIRSNQVFFFFIAAFFFKKKKFLLSRIILRNVFGLPLRNFGLDGFPFASFFRGHLSGTGF